MNTNQNQQQAASQGQQQGQNQNQISNPQSNALPQVKGPEMNDRDRVNDVLATEKYLISMSNIAAWEASHQALYQDINTICHELQDCHRQLYELMFQYGWYKLEAEEQQKLDQAYQQFSSYATQFPYAGQTH